ncbi:MAG: efflux RND transporter periplasmic adaptor subunit [Chloroflexota bacterium]
MSIVVALLLTSCAIQTVTEPHRVDPENEPTPVPTSVAIAKQTYTVERGEVIKEIVLSGQVVPEIELSINFAMNGEVSEILVDRGDQVSEGDLIAVLNQDAINNELFLAESSLTVAQAQLTAVQNQIANNRRRAEIGFEQLQLRLDYLNSLVDGEPTPEQSLEIGLVELDIELAELGISELSNDIDPALQAAVDQAQLRVDELNAMLENSQLVAPFDGVVTRLQVDVGDTVTSQTTAVIISDLDQLVVRSFVVDEDLEQMLEGQPVFVALSSRPGETFPAIVQAMPLPFGTSDELEANTAVFAFEDNSAADLESGNRVTIELVLDQREDVLWLPAAALREFRGRFFVVVQDGDVQRRVDVELGLQADDRAEVVTGLDEGAIVLGP